MSNIVKNIDSKVYLEPIEHVYIHKVTGERYKSVTTMLSKIEPHFDEKGVSLAIVNQPDTKKKPEYIGKTQDQILEMWAYTNNEANEFGTFIHNTIEKYLLSDKIWFPQDKLQSDIISGYESLNIDEGVRMYPERILFSEEHKLAGMSDLIIDVNDYFFSVRDWKTNKVINYYNKYGNQTLLKPFDYLQDCQYVIYTLQLSTYAYMYELETGMKCRDIAIGYWDRDKNTMVNIPVMYMKNEAKKLLEIIKIENMVY